MPEPQDTQACAVSVHIRIATTLDEVDRDAWDGLEHGSSPFLRWGFLRALELSRSIGADSGWYPFYLLAETPQALLGAVPVFVKSHSYGEFIFDWSWANAYERSGRSYYPKLVVAAPLTPASGPRILIAAGVDAEAFTELFVDAVGKLADEVDASSVHWLFTTAAEQARLTALRYAPRASFQFHWHNPGYADFDGFLATLTSRRRKQIRKERRRVSEQVGAVTFTPAAELGAERLARIDGFYRRNTDRHGGMDYLRPGFFTLLAELMPEHFLVADVEAAGEIIAGAVYLESDRFLYGRYWGCSREVDLLHFEVTCYAGIARAIERGLTRFEAGAQGEHKLLRGFAPTPTYSSHWFRDPELDGAVRNFLVHEADEVAARMASLERCGPYKSG